MSEDRTLDELQALDAVATEQGAVLGFRVCEDSDEVEPVLVRVHAANPGAPNETALVAITDRCGMSLGRYVIPRERLDRAMAGAVDVDGEAAEPAVVPSEWERSG